ncbi:unnamed protein product [Linum trigynum]|uniref:Uncharacterized protein n=1 Tax=Linum trigynum TaxID=586398 RepID=A0AAV2GB68_9ROSI
MVVRANMYGYQLGEFPVPYLGVPLVAGKLTVNACRPLIDRITSRVQGWKAKSLSYAGRVELVGSILYSMSQYWMNVFMLPKTVIREVERICNNFLWSVGPGLNLKAKMAWKYMSIPKKEGGLGLRDLTSWNYACVFRQIWAVMMQHGSLWVAWIQAYKLKGRDFWAVTVSGSWNWGEVAENQNKDP